MNVMATTRELLNEEGYALIVTLSGPPGRGERERRGRGWERRERKGREGRGEERGGGERKGGARERGRGVK